MADDVDLLKGMCLDVVMEQLFRVNKVLNLTSAPTKEAFFGFSCGEVRTLYFQKRDRSGAGFYFCLHDGRVFDAAGRIHESDPALYEGTLYDERAEEGMLH